jgi:hypothetical protein
MTFQKMCPKFRTLGFNTTALYILESSQTNYSWAAYIDYNYICFLSLSSVPFEQTAPLDLLQNINLNLSNKSVNYSYEMLLLHFLFFFTSVIFNNYIPGDLHTSHKNYNKYMHISL